MSEAVRFIVITTPPHEVARAIDAARRLVCDVGRSSAALAYPPHVTLRTGARVPAELVADFLDSFGAVVGEWEPFLIRTEGFWRTAYMEGEIQKYLIGYRVAKDPPLAALNERLLRFATWRVSNRLHFEPHVTLAFDDLDLDGFNFVERWREQNPGALPAGFSWTCDNVGLYRREGDVWTAYKVWHARGGEVSPIVSARAPSRDSGSTSQGGRRTV